MSEYWVSKKKYFCKYCEIYIADDVPSRQQHENGLRHKGNLERFIRNIYKASEKKKKDLEEEKRELARIEQAAHAAFAQDVSTGHARPGIPSTSTSPSSVVRKPITKPSDPFANYTTAVSLGYTDPAVEGAVAEAERRRTQGLVGEWQVITPSPPSNSHIAEPESREESETPSVQIPSKREVEMHPDDEFDRHSKLRKKTVGPGLGEIYDPGLISFKIKKKEDSVVEPKCTSFSAVKPEDDQPKATEAPKWVKVQWKRPDEFQDGASPKFSSVQNETRQQGDEGKEESASISSEGPSPKVESDVLPVKVESIPPTLVDAPEVSTGGLFKKRRIPASGSAGMGRRQL